ncbi:hypothetical protein PMAYCL1PPCAC_19087, partial [Pristionchus mayeri]
YARHRQTYSIQGTFYPVVVGLIIFTTLNTIVQAVFVAPEYAHVIQIVFSSSSYLHVYLFLDMLSNYGILGFSTLVAANRFSTFNMGVSCIQEIFRRPRLYFIIALVTLFVSLLAATPAALGCTMLHAETAAGYMDVCPNERIAEGVKTGLAATYYVVCLASAYFYVRTYWLIKNQRGYLIEKESHRTAPEIIILKQALVIFGLYIISLVLSTILPLFPSSHSILLSFSLNFVSLLLSTVYPGLFLVSAKDMRREVSSWIPLTGSTSCWRGKQRVGSAEPMTSRYRMSMSSKQSE